MNTKELIEFLDGESSMTETVLLNTLLDYLVSIGQVELARSMKALMERASRGNTSLLTSSTINAITGIKSTYTYKDDRTRRR